jgi:hypothetical protein
MIKKKKKQPMKYRRKIIIQMKEPEFFQSRMSPATSYSFVFVWLYRLKMHDSFVSFVFCLVFSFFSTFLLEYIILYYYCLSYYSLFHTLISLGLP